MELTKEIKDYLIKLKVRYFGSQFFSLDNFLVFNEVQLPEGLTREIVEEIGRHWPEEKQTELAKSKVFTQGITQQYQSMILNRIDQTTALQNKINILLGDIPDSKDAQQIAKTIQTLAKVQDEAAKLLKVEAFKNYAYEKNKAATENLLKENRYPIRETGVVTHGDFENQKELK